MGIDFKGLEVSTTPLVDLTGHKAPILGSIGLITVIGEEPWTITMLIKFPVIDASSAYNSVLGWPSFNASHAIMSTLHQVMKFLM